MLIDHEKFIALLADNAGLSVEEAEKRLSELLSEMADAFSEDNAYEVEGFGIFSKLGQAVHFMPSKELETEINYKYAGMSPIELPGFEQGEKPLREAEAEEEPDSFDSESDPDEEAAAAPAEEDTADDVFTEFLQMQKEEDAEEEEEQAGGTESDTPQEPSGFDETFAGLIDDDFEQDEIDAAGRGHDLTDSGREEAEETPMTDDPFSIFESSGTEDEKTAGADAEEVFSDSPEAGAEENSQPAEGDERPHSSDEPPGPEEWGIDAHKEDEEDNEAAFTGLFSDSETAGTEKQAEKKGTEDDFIPVVQNVSAKAARQTDTPGKEEKPKKAAKKDEVNPVVSVILYMILIILITGIMGYVLVHFNMIDISRFTKSEASVAQTVQPQAPQTVAEQSQQPAETPEPVLDETAGSNAEPQTPGEPADEPESAAQPEPAAGPADFGLTGAVNAAANQGYTIVLFHLSNKNSAEREFETLNNNGLRALLKEIPSAKYGVLYRVSIGQFRTAADAAIAAGENKNLITGEYSITKIN